MTPRRRAILIVVLIAALLVAIVIGIMYLSRSLAPAPDAAGTGTESPTDVFEPVAVEPAFENPLLAPAPSAPGRTAGMQMAELFAERYGSYSNQGEYQNLRDLLPVMTARFRQETEAFLATAAPASGAAFEGVTSVKVSTDVRSIDEDSAIIAVSLQQERTNGSAVTTGYRTLRMELLKVGEDWRVDRASWEG